MPPVCNQNATRRRFYFLFLVRILQQIIVKSNRKEVKVTKHIILKSENNNKQKSCLIY